MTPVVSAIPPPRTAPAFSPTNVLVIFVLGGPGAGKGTQCAYLVRDFSFTHLSAGDLLRAEQSRPNSESGNLIRQCIRDGQIVPMEITVALLEKAMRQTIDSSGQTRFLIDGFPRKLDQALRFESQVCPSRFVLFFETSEEVMERRLLHRGETSGREDDNLDSIRKRFRTFLDTSMPVVDEMERHGKVIRIDASPEPEEVYRLVKANVIDRLNESVVA